MNRVRFVFIAFALLTLSCDFVSSAFATPTPTAHETTSYPNCLDPQPTQKDIDRTLQYTDKYFSTPAWKRNYSVMEYRVSVSRKNDDLGALANFDYVTFCDVTNAALDNYYTDEAFDIIFQYYDGYEIQKDCRSNNVRLYELKMQNQGIDYNARFWVEILDENHTRESLLVFPISDPDNLDSYSKKIMSKLSSCE